MIKSTNLAVTCIKCQKDFDHILYKNTMARDVMFHCDSCKYIIDHTCTQCGKIIDKFCFDSICFDCAKCIKVTCIKCQCIFDLDVPQYYTEYHDTIAYDDLCLIHPENKYCDCIINSYIDIKAKSDTIKQYPYIGCALPICYCKKCKYDNEHSCSKCGVIVDEFSYSDVCKDCDYAAFPKPDETICYFCHRRASEFYKGKSYCDWCI